MYFSTLKAAFPSLAVRYNSYCPSAAVWHLRGLPARRGLCFARFRPNFFSTTLWAASSRPHIQTQPKQVVCPPRPPPSSLPPPAFPPLRKNNSSPLGKDKGPLSPGLRPCSPQTLTLQAPAEGKRAGRTAHLPDRELPA